MRLARHYTVVGNQLAQHRQLSATAIGVAVHIQSLPTGARVSVKALAARFPEGEVRIGAALRELEKHGFLERRRERLATGQVVTRTYSYNVPGPTSDGQPEPPEPPEPPGRPRSQDQPPVPQPRLQPQPQPRPQPRPRPRTEPESEPLEVYAPAPTPAPAPAPAPAPEFVAQPAPETVSVPDAPAAPEQQHLHADAVDLLAGLRRRDPRLLLAERDVRRLAPGVSAWLERGVSPEMVARSLSSDLPDQIRRPASVLAYRLAELIPPYLPPVPEAPERPDMKPPDPMQNCDGCERGHRAPKPGRCSFCPPADADADADADSGTDTDTETDSGTEPDAEAEPDTEAEPGTRVVRGPRWPDGRPWLKGR
ncbi:helix-turn-helix domain-containing protein [Streptomyces sp. NPDC006459]|uniref:helix-turn-helix domain-containing protein n=1 Tax=Streptomyces sp. NPDC006459 TaxID=3154303 RepID=UPI0033A1AEF3